MPGMADPDIAIDLASSATKLSGVGDSGHLYAPRPRLASLTLSLMGLDVAVTVCAAVLSYGLFRPPSAIAPSSILLPMICLAASVCLSFFESGLYTPTEIMNHELPWRKMVFGWLQAGAIGTFAIFWLTPPGENVSAPGSGHLSVTLQSPWLPLFLIAGFGGIASARWLRLRLRTGAKSLNRTVIIGEPISIRDLLLRITTASRPSFNVIGIVDSTEDSGSRQRFLGIPVFEDLDALEQMIRRDVVDVVLVALPLSAGEQMRAIIQRISMAPVDVYVYPATNELDLPLRAANRASDLPLLMACARPIDGWRAYVKRAEDIALSAGLLVFISPVMLAIAASVKLTSKGPVLFRQRRLGYNNRVIEVLKFRSMYTHLSDADAAQQSLRGDKRVTRIGAWLRKTSLDELPQLLNVLKGDMSLVGPRPHALATTAGGLALEEAVPVYPSRHRVKPGITGWAQVNGYRGALDSVDKIVHRVNHDLYYIENWSLTLDLKILWRTAWLVFADDNAF